MESLWRGTASRPGPTLGTIDIFPARITIGGVQWGLREVSDPVFPHSRAVFRPIQALELVGQLPRKRPPRRWRVRRPGHTRGSSHGVSKCIALGCGRTGSAPRFARDWAVDRGARSYALDGAARVPRPGDGRLGAGEVALRAADLDEGGCPRQRALGVATGARMRRRTAIGLRRIPLRRKAETAWPDGRALHRRGGRRAALEAADLRP